jgi:hypothetical protein
VRAVSPSASTNVRKRKYGPTVVLIVTVYIFESLASKQAVIPGSYPHRQRTVTRSNISMTLTPLAALTKSRANTPYGRIVTVIHATSNQQAHITLLNLFHNVLCGSAISDNSPPASPSPSPSPSPTSPSPRPQPTPYPHSHCTGSR